MNILVENVGNIEFSNEALQLVALICSLLTNVSLLAIPLIIKQREESISGFKDKIERYKNVEQELKKCLDELRAIKIICESSENSSEIFSPYADQAEMATYYQRIIYQIESKAKKALPKNISSSNNNQGSNYRGL